MFNNMFLIKKQMIQHDIATHLLSVYQEKECRHENKETNHRVAVLVETRDCFFLPYVIKNFCHLLGDGWNFHLFVNEKVKNFLSTQLPHFQYQWTPLPVLRMSKEQYSFLLRQKNFWKQIREEVVLVFQADCLLLKQIPLWAEQYDMIGAVCGSVGEGKHIYNGGFSIRSKNTMLEVALDTDENQNENRPEDVFFTEELRNKGRLPDLWTAHAFASECVDSTHCVGIHGTDKYYSC